MSALERDGDKPFSLEKVRILLLDGEATSMSILGQILSGFGARSLQKCSHIEEAKAQLQKNEFDLIIVDPATEQGEGYAVPRWIRRSCTPPNRFCPVVMVTGHTESARIHQLRDSGANFVVAKPLTPACLYERIAWLGRDKRPYVECKVYAGPDRRFKFQGPPSGSDGRREADLSAEVGAASEPNMSQGDIDALLQPRKIHL